MQFILPTGRLSERMSFCLLSGELLFQGGIKLRKSRVIKLNGQLLSGATVLFVIFCLLNLRYLPVIDFLPYKKDVRIADKMIIPEGAPADQYKTTFIYEKDGIRKEFSLEIILQMIQHGNLLIRNLFL